MTAASSRPPPRTVPRKAIAKNVELGSGPASATTAKGNFTVAGNLVVSDTTTTIDTTNMVVKDNLVQLNSAPGAAGKFPGLLMARHADDHAGLAGDESAAFLFDEAVDRFKLGYTGDNAESSTVTVSRADDLQIEKLYCSAMWSPATSRRRRSRSPTSRASRSRSAWATRSPHVTPENTLDHYGAYEQIVLTRLLAYQQVSFGV